MKRKNHLSNKNRSNALKQSLENFTLNFKSKIEDKKNIISLTGLFTILLFVSTFLSYNAGMLKAHNDIDMIIQNQQNEIDKRIKMREAKEKRKKEFISNWKKREVERGDEVSSDHIIEYYYEFLHDERNRPR